MTKISIILGVIMLLGSCTSNNQQTSQTVERLSATAFSAKLDTTKDAVIIDVRTPEEFANGHLKDAININYDGSDFERHIAEIEKSKPVFLYCLSGARSYGAAESMRKAGFENVTDMADGMIACRANALPESQAAKNTERAQGISFAQFEALIASEKPVLIDFYADWCIPCKKMAPYLHTIAEEKKESLTLVRIDADENADLCKKLGVIALPFLKLYKSNTLLWENEGFTEEKDVRAQLKKHL